MQVALVHQVLADLAADVVLEEDIVGQDDRGAAAGFEAAVDVLQERELLVGGRVFEVVAGRAAAALFGAEGWVGEDDVGGRESGALARQGVADGDAALDVVQQQVHAEQALDVLDQLHRHHGVFDLELLLGGGQLEDVVVLAGPVVGGDQEAAGAGGGVLHDLTGARLHARDDAIDERARREVLAGARLELAGVLLEQALVEVAEALRARLEPVEPVDRLDQRPQVTRLLERRARVAKDRLDLRRAVTAEAQQQAAIKRELLRAVLVLEVGPAVAGG